MRLLGGGRRLWTDSHHFLLLSEWLFFFGACLENGEGGDEEVSAETLFPKHPGLHTRVCLL